MPTDKAKYSPETRAVKMAAGDIRKVMKTFQEEGKIPFMQQKQSKATQNVYDTIKKSALAMQMLSEHYPVAICYRVAQLEKQKFSEQGLNAEGLAAKLAEQGVTPNG